MGITMFDKDQQTRLVGFVDGVGVGWDAVDGRLRLVQGGRIGQLQCSAPYTYAQQNILLAKGELTELSWQPQQLERIDRYRHWFHA